MTTAPHARPATWEEYLALGENRQAEYIDGQIVMSPAPNLAHQRACERLTHLLRPVLPPTHEVIAGWGWKPNANEFIADVMAFARNDENTRYTGVPALTVEVLSSNRSDDLVWKFNRYAQAGLPFYWIVDLRDQVVLTYELVDGRYLLQARVTSGHPVEVSFGVSAARLDLDEILTPL